jgi:hypothetical protein
MAAAASLEKSRPVKFLIKGITRFDVVGVLPEPLIFEMPVNHWPLFGLTFIFFGGSCIDVPVWGQ